MSSIIATSAGADRIVDTYSDVQSGQNVSGTQESSVDDGSDIKTASAKTLGSPEAPLNEDGSTSATKKEKRRFFSKIAGAFDSIGDGVKGAAKLVGRKASNVLGSIGSGVKNASKAVGQGVVKAGKAVAGGVKTAAQAVGKGVVKAGKAIGDAARAIGSGVKSTAKTVGKGITNAAKETYGFLSKTTQKILPYLGPALMTYLGATTGGASSSLFARMFGGMSANTGMNGGGMPGMNGNGMPGMNGNGMPGMNGGGMPGMNGNGMPGMNGNGMPGMNGGGMFDPTVGYSNNQPTNSWSPMSMMNYRYYTSMLNSISNSISNSILNSLNTINALTNQLGSINLGSLFGYGQSAGVKSSILPGDEIEEAGEEGDDSLLAMEDGESVPVRSGSGSAQSGSV